MSIAGVKDVYACDGVTDEFAITFPFAKSTDVHAFVESTTTGERIALVRNLDYTIRGTTLVLRNDDFREPWSADYQLCIIRRTRIEQPSSQAMSPETFAKRVDELTRMYQQLQEQLRRTLHTGINYPPLNLTSAPYSYIYQDSLNAYGAGVNNSLFELTPTDSISPHALTILSGTMILPIVTYEDWPVDEVHPNGMTLLSGTMFLPIVTYSDWPPDEVHPNGMTLLSGNMIAPVITYVDWPADELHPNSIALLSGTMTT